MIKKGVRVRILRKESYWYNKTGTIISVDGPKDEGQRYPVTVRFDTVNWEGINTARFGESELAEAGSATS